MKAVCWEGRNDVRVEHVPDPTLINPRDAIVRVTSTAICGSDLHLYDGFIPTMRAGDILGHEFMGIVEDVGRGVTNLKKGDRVIVPFPIAGGRAQYARVPFADVGPFKVPQHLTDEQVLFLTDIYPTGFMAAENCNIQRGDTVAVWGCGPVGQFAIRSAFLLGAGRVIAIDTVPERLMMANQGGAETIDSMDPDVFYKLRYMTGGIGPDACIDAVGMEAHGPHLDYVYDKLKTLSLIHI